MKKTKDINAGLVETAAKAQAQGMTYGQYIAWQQTQKERRERETRKRDKERN